MFLLLVIVTLPLLIHVADANTEEQKPYCIYDYGKHHLITIECYATYNESRNALYQCSIRPEYCVMGFSNSTLFIDERGCLLDDRNLSCSNPKEYKTIPYDDEYKTIPYDEHYKHVGMIKKTTGQIVNVFPSSLEKLAQRGWGTLGSTWSLTCSSFTAGDQNGCLMNRSPLERCMNLNYESPSQHCIQFDIKPKTVDDCKDMYRYGYLHKFFSENSTLVYPVTAYASLKCDLYPKASTHSQQCQDWWSHYQKVSQNYGSKISEKSFIIQYCLPDAEPDWEDFDLWGHFIFSHNDKKHYGHLNNFENTIKKRCVEHTCNFYHYGGKNSTFQCPEIVHGDDYDPFSSFIKHSFEFNNQTGSYECVIDYYYFEPWRGLVKTEISP